MSGKRIRKGEIGSGVSGKIIRKGEIGSGMKRELACGFWNEWKVADVLEHRHQVKYSQALGILPVLIQFFTCSAERCDLY